MTAYDNIQDLILELDVELAHFQQLAVDVAESMARFGDLTEVSLHDMRALAMLLTEIYMGAENVMLRVAKGLAEPIPSGRAWHKTLLNQLSIESPGLRPPLFSTETISLLDGLRRFRHVARHVYPFSYQWEPIKELLAMAGPLLQKLIQDTEEFKSFLISVTTGDNEE